MTAGGRVRAQPPPPRVFVEREGGAALHGACVRGDTAAVASLLDSRASLVESLSWRGLTPLLSALEAGEEAAARLLIARGASVGAAGPDGRGALHLAACAGVVGAVLPAWPRCEGVDPVDGRGVTPLGEAVVAGRHEACRELLLQGASARARLGGAPLVEVAARRGDAAAVRMLAEAGGEATGEALALAARAGSASACEALLELGADPRGAVARGDAAAAVLLRWTAGEAAPQRERRAIGRATRAHLPGDLCLLCAEYAVPSGFTHGGASAAAAKNSASQPGSLTPVCFASSMAAPRVIK